jgi:hypothetical protein
VVDIIYEKLMQSLKLYQEMNHDLSMEIENLTSMVRENNEALQKERQDYDFSVRIIKELQEMKY